MDRSQIQLFFLSLLTDQARSGVLRMARYGMHTKEQIAKIARNFSDPSVAGMKPRRLSAAAERRAARLQGQMGTNLPAFMRPKFMSGK